MLLLPFWFEIVMNINFLVKVCTVLSKLLKSAQGTNPPKGTKNFTGGIFSTGGGNLRRSHLDHSYLFEN